MPKLVIKNLNNEVVGELDLYEGVFSVKVNKSLLHAAVKHYLDSLRQGTSASKNRAQVRGGGKKPWRQKGTGRARAGSTRNPIWRHGGVAHGPQPRTYDWHLPKKMILGALRSALTEKFNGNAIQVVDVLSLPNHKARDFRKILNQFDIRQKLLIVESDENENLLRASRNFPDVKLVKNFEVNVYDILNSERLLFSKTAIQKLQEALNP